MKSLTFMSVGVTTRADVIARLGPPAGVDEGDRIQTYRLWGDGCAVRAPRGWTPGADGQPADGCREARLSPEGEQPGEVASPAFSSRHQEQFSLVLVFDAQGRLARRQLVRLRRGHPRVVDEEEAGLLLARARAW